MTQGKLILSSTLAAAAFFATPAFAEDAAAPAQATLPAPAMAGPLGLNSTPHGFDAGPLGKIYVDGAVSAIGLTQNRPASTDHHARGDLSNGTVFIQNSSGPVQFFVQAGAYSLPAVGTTYLNARKTTAETFGYVPVAYLKGNLPGGLSISAGKLPTLIGTEYLYTFQNSNIERGLVWNQEPAVSHGIQADYSTGPLSLSLSWNDGFYSNKYNWISGLAAYKLDDSNTLTFSGGLNTGETSHVSVATPIAQNNSEIADLALTHVDGPLTLTPSIQYTRVPKNVSLGINNDASTYGASLIAKYSFDQNYSLGARAEYISTLGSVGGGAPNLLYGQGSRAWTFTVTPTYQYDMLFARAEGSYVRASKVVAGSALGPAGNDKSQGRLMLEAGFLF